jgi:hypothetical protein
MIATDGSGEVTLRHLGAAGYQEPVSEPVLYDPAAPLDWAAPSAKMRTFVGRKIALPGLPDDFPITDEQKLLIGRLMAHLGESEQAPEFVQKQIDEVLGVATSSA